MYAHTHTHTHNTMHPSTHPPESTSTPNMIPRTFQNWIPAWVPQAFKMDSLALHGPPWTLKWRHACTYGAMCACFSLHAARTTL